MPEQITGEQLESSSCDKENGWRDCPICGCEYYVDDTINDADMCQECWIGGME